MRAKNEGKKQGKGKGKTTNYYFDVLFGQYEFLATEQAETYLQICVFISHSTYICPNSFDCEELIQKMFFCEFQTLNP